HQRRPPSPPRPPTPAAPPTPPHQLPHPPGSCPATLSSRRSVAAHVRRPVSLGLVTLVTRLVTRTHFSRRNHRRNHPPLQLITQHHHISFARHRTPDPPNQQARSNIFSTPKKIAGKNQRRGAPGPECFSYCHSPSRSASRSSSPRQLAKEWSLVRQFPSMISST